MGEDCSTERKFVPVEATKAYVSCQLHSPSVLPPRKQPHYQLKGMMVELHSWTGRFEVRRYRTTNPRSACT